MQKQRLKQYCVTENKYVAGGKMENTKQIGDAGEQCAAEYLEDSDYEILNRNYRVPAGEIDIIALSPEEVCVFCEVKTRRSTEFGLACEAVDRRKQEHIIKAAMSYSFSGDMRFDVIEVYYKIQDGRFVPNKINHIKNAFDLF